MSFYQVLLLLLLVAAASGGADVQPRCGRVSGNVGGQDIPPGRWPWVAVLYEHKRVFCSGSLISDQWVMISASCLRGISPSAVTVVLGRTNQTGSNPNEVSRGITQTVCHPLSNSPISDNALCLVKLSSPVESSDHISPVCLAAETSTFPNGTFSWIAAPVNVGKKLVEFQLQLLGNNECQNRSIFKITENKICTRDDPSREEPCLFSIGAPLMIHNDDLVWIQVGVSLFHSICRKSTSPSLYTRVSRYREWISDVTGSSQPGFVTFPSSGDDGTSASTRSLPRASTTPPIIPPRPTCDRSIFSSSEKLSSTFFTSVLALLSSLVVLLV